MTTAATMPPAYPKIDVQITSPVTSIMFGFGTLNTFTMNASASMRTAVTTIPSSLFAASPCMRSYCRVVPLLTCFPSSDRFLASFPLSTSKRISQVRHLCP